MHLQSKQGNHNHVIKADTSEIKNSYSTKNKTASVLLTCMYELRQFFLINEEFQINTFQQCKIIEGTAFQWKRSLNSMR